jgi:hypothetical protein
MTQEQQAESPFPPSLIRILAEIVDLPLPEDRLAKVVEAFKNFLTQQRELDKIDLTGIDPAMTYDPRWE